MNTDLATDASLTAGPGGLEFYPGPVRPKLKLCWFAVYRPTRGFPCDPNIFLVSKKNNFFPTCSGKVRILTFPISQYYLFVSLF